MTIASNMATQTSTDAVKTDWDKVTVKDIRWNMVDPCDLAGLPVYNPITKKATMLKSDFALWVEKNGLMGWIKENHPRLIQTEEQHVPYAVRMARGMK